MLLKRFSLVGNRTSFGRKAWLSLGLAVLLCFGVLELIELLLQQSKYRAQGLLKITFIFLGGEGIEWQIGQWLGQPSLVEFIAFSTCLLSTVILPQIIKRIQTNQ